MQIYKKKCKNANVYEKGAAFEDVVKAAGVAWGKTIYGMHLAKKAYLCKLKCHLYTTY